MNKNNNLVSLADRPKNDRTEIARKGGIKSGESRRNAKTMRKILITMLSSPVSNKHIAFMHYDIPDEDKTHMALVCNGIINAAQQGNIKALEKIIELIGDK